MQTLAVARRIARAEFANNPSQLIDHYAEQIRPTTTEAYLDRITLWLRRPISQLGCRFLTQVSRRVEIRRAEQIGPRKRGFVQRLELFGPTRDALRYLIVAHQDACLTYVEFALDWTFATECERDDAHYFAYVGAITKYRHRKIVRSYLGTRYSGPRSALNNFVLYADKPSRINGRPCVHFEWRTRGARALRATGISAAMDLLHFDHHSFWKRRLLFAAVDIRKFGRTCNNYHFATNRRTEWTSTGRRHFRYSFDARTGSLHRKTHVDVQSVIDEYKHRVAVHKCLVLAKAVGHLLPAP